MMNSATMLRDLAGRPDDPRVLRARERLRETAWAACDGRGLEALRFALPELRQVRGRD
jgi:hypothetical protein